MDRRPVGKGQGGLKILVHPPKYFLILHAPKHFPCTVATTFHTLHYFQNTIKHPLVFLITTFPTFLGHHL